MRDEKEGRKKQARSNKQQDKGNTAHPTCIYIQGFFQVFCDGGGQNEVKGVVGGLNLGALLIYQ